MQFVAVDGISFVDHMGGGGRRRQKISEEGLKYSLLFPSSIPVLSLVYPPSGQNQGPCRREDQSFAERLGNHSCNKRL